MFKKIKPIIEWTIMAFLGVVFVIVISPILPIKNAPKIYSIVSPSMEPTIMTGSIVVATAVNPEHIKVGDVVAFQDPQDANRIIMHRVVQISTDKPTTLQTKGDNNKTKDNWQIYASGVKGKMWITIPNIGYLAIFVRQPLGFGLLIALPALIFITFQIFGLKKAINEEIEKRVHEKLKKPSSGGGITKLFSILFVGGISLSLGTFPNAKSLLSSNATVSGINLSAKEKLEKCKKEDDEKLDNEDKQNDKDEKKQNDKCKEYEDDREDQKHDEEKN